MKNKLMLAIHNYEFDYSDAQYFSAAKSHPFYKYGVLTFQNLINSYIPLTN